MPLFADLMTRYTGIGVAQRQHDDSNFRDLARDLGFRTRDKDVPFDESTVILVGVQTNPSELAALDDALDHLAVPVSAVELLNLSACEGTAYLDRYAPDIGKILVSPLVAVWKNSGWTQVAFGHTAATLMKHGLGRAGSLMPIYVWKNR